MKGIKITTGMANKIFGGYSGRIKLRCDNCSLSIPVYKGRYSQKCPSCSKDLYFVEENSLKNYYGFLLEYFINHRGYIETFHNFSIRNITKDLLRFNTMPLLCSLRIQGSKKDLFEGLYSITHPSFRKGNPTVEYMLEQAIEKFDSKEPVLSGLKTIGLFTNVLLEESLIEGLKNEAIILFRNPPNWINEENSGILSEDRKKQILIESFLYAKKYFEYDEAIKFSKRVLKNELLWLNEALWKNDTPPGLIRNSLKKKDISWSSGGFRFRLKKDDTLNKLRDFQKKILSKRNSAAGIGKRIASIRQILQRKKALNKANQWHKVSPYSGLLHKGLGQLLHRAGNKNEGYLRLFNDCTDYFTGTILPFSFTKKELLEQQIKKGDVYTLKKAVIMASSNREFPNRIQAGEQIKIISITPAKEWGGGYPGYPMGQFIYEVEVLTGEKKNEYYELDSVDLADSIGIDEGIKFSIESPDGCLFINDKKNSIEEVIISSYGFSLTENQIGALNRKIRSFENVKKNYILRVYNDEYDKEILIEDISKSQFSRGRNPYFINKNILIFEASPEYTKVIEKYKKKIEDLKGEYERAIQTYKATIGDTKYNIEKAKTIFQENLATIQAEKIKELTNLKKRNEDISVKIHIRGNLC